jgi:glycosyltransferase involved in cell wall biosynthesis
MAIEENISQNMIAISVVVPVRNEEDSVRVLLDRLLDQTRRPDEIVLADGGSTDRTRDIIEEFIQRGAPVKLVCEEFSMPGRARNQGVRAAQHSWIAFTDAGITPERDWLANLETKVGDGSKADAVYGSYEPVIGNFFEECAAIAYVPPGYETGEGLARPYSIVSALMRRKVWETVGGFPEDLRSAEDLLFMRNVERAGFQIVRAPAAIVHWSIQPNLWRTFKRFVSYSRNNIRAGLWREWQAAIFVRYAVIVASAIPAVFFGWLSLSVTLGLWLGLMIARAVKSITRNRTAYPAGFMRNVGRVFLLVPILAAIDAAAFVGSIDWLVRDKLGLGKKHQ